MGWAKYYEDNLSIMNNRLPFTYAEKEEPIYQVRPSIHEAVKVAPSRKRDRAELKIHLQVVIIVSQPASYRLTDGGGAS